MSASKIKSILVITYTPSPYQVEFFNQIALEAQYLIKVAYLYTRENGRQWEIPHLNHEYIILNDVPTNYDILMKWADESELVIFNYYRHPKVLSLLHTRANSKRAWCFWGERPGYHRYGLIGVYYRKWQLRMLVTSRVPIWGIGGWAIEQYRREFGTKRNYFNLPYFSNLNRFCYSKNNKTVSSQIRKFLFSGSLIPRKGIDLLAIAFDRLAKENPDVTLDIMGDGPLRASLEKLLGAHKDRVTFWGFRPWNDLPYHYNQADFLCVPSQYDGWGLVVPEGLAAGLPVIATNNTGAAIEFIHTNVNGWLISANSVDDLYHAMKQATDLQPSELCEYSWNAQQSVKNHSLADGARRFLELVDASLNF
jgi:glycosyltransferase involved in cell wall biosynthesis